MKIVENTKYRTMKKLTMAIVLTFMLTSAYAQQGNRGLFDRGDSPETSYTQSESTPLIPLLGKNNDQNAPLGGELLLIGLGAAYAMLRKPRNNRLR